MFVFTLQLHFFSLLFAMASGDLVAVDRNGDGEVSYPRVPMEVPRRSLVQSLSPFRLIGGLPSRTTLSYNRMPVEPIKLSVLKLDGSSFDIEVLKTATVGELKMAVEALFSNAPNKGPGMISWPHVWGHFCLYYEGHKLITDTDYLSNFGIKDGDQLHFIRHVSNDCFHLKQKKTWVSSPKPKLSLPKPKPRKKERKFHDDNVETVARSQGSLIGNTLRGWLSYSMSSYRGGTQRNNAVSSTFSRHRGGLREFATMFRFKCYSEKDIWDRRLISKT